MKDHSSCRPDVYCNYCRYFPCDVCKEQCWDIYMLKDEVWLSITPAKQGHVMHFACAQIKLGRLITPDDLNDSDINRPLRLFWRNALLTFAKR